VSPFRIPSEVAQAVCRVKVMRRILGDCSNAKAYQLIGSGAVESYLDGTARMVVVASIYEYVARQLEAAKPVDGSRVQKAASRSVDLRRARRLRKHCVVGSPAGGPPQALNVAEGET
jgi:hypothetical protein